MHLASPPEGQIAKNLIEMVADQARQRRVTDVRIGLSYTAVILDDGATGVALTLREASDYCCQHRLDPMPLAGRSAEELIEKLQADSPIDAAVGLACINALINRPQPDQLAGDIMEQLSLGPDDQVGMVGNFQPIVKRIKPTGAKLHIFERIEAPSGNLLPAEDAKRVLPDCSVALITATTLINHTLDDLIEAASPCREVVLLGASTPLCPEAFRQTAVTMISGVTIPEPEPVLQIISEGGGMHVFKHHVNKVNIPLSNRGEPIP